MIILTNRKKQEIKDNIQQIEKSSKHLMELETLLYKLVNSGDSFNTKKVDELIETTQVNIAKTRDKIALCRADLYAIGVY